MLELSVIVQLVPRAARLFGCGHGCFSCCHTPGPMPSTDPRTAMVLDEERPSSPSRAAREQYALLHSDRKKGLFKRDKAGDDDDRY